MICTAYLYHWFDCVLFINSNFCTTIRVYVSFLNILQSYHITWTLPLWNTDIKGRWGRKLKISAYKRKWRKLHVEFLSFNPRFLTYDSYQLNKWHSTNNPAQAQCATAGFLRLLHSFHHKMSFYLFCKCHASYLYLYFQSNARCFI